MLPAQYRMRKSSDFHETVKHGMRTVQPDMVLHARWAPPEVPGPRIGLIVAKAVGSAVQRHRVARRLRHVARGAIGRLQPSEQLVIRARPSSRTAASGGLERQLHAGIDRLHQMDGAQR